MNIDIGAFGTVQGSRKALGMESASLSAAGDLATFIVILSIARAWDGPEETGIDPRLR